MNTVKSRIRTPANRIIKLKIPDSVPINQDVDVILIYNNDENSYQSKIDLLKNIIISNIFLEDIKSLSEDFKTEDSKVWE
ncbi:MAG: hypothetical protein V1779_01960 [bacterium]